MTAIKGPFSHKHQDIGSLRNHQNSKPFFCDYELISFNENLYITFLEPEKFKKHGYKFVRQREVRKHTKLKYFDVPQTGNFINLMR